MTTPEEETKTAEVDAASCNPKLPKHMATWGLHMGRLEPASLNRTENFVQFQGPLAERSDGFSRKCAILVCTSHPATACFRRRSFRISVCKTSLITQPARWVNSGLLQKHATAKSFTRASDLVISGAASGTRVQQYDKNSGAYHTSFNHQRWTKSPSETQKCM